MSTESAAFLTAIVVAFVVFGTMLAWVDVYANRARSGNHPAE